MNFIKIWLTCYDCIKGFLKNDSILEHSNRCTQKAKSKYPNKYLDKDNTPIAKHKTLLSTFLVYKIKKLCFADKMFWAEEEV